MPEIYTIGYGRDSKENFQKRLNDMEWYEHLFGILAVVTCVLLPFGGIGILLFLFAHEIEEWEKHEQSR